MKKLEYQALKNLGINEIALEVYSTSDLVILEIDENEFKIYHNQVSRGNFIGEFFDAKSIEEYLLCLGGVSEIEIRKIRYKELTPKLTLKIEEILNELTNEYTMILSDDQIKFISSRTSVRENDIVKIYKINILRIGKGACSNVNKTTRKKGQYC